MEKKIKQKELNISFYVIRIDLKEIQKSLNNKNKLLKETKEDEEIKKKIEEEIEELKIIQENKKNHAILSINTYEFCMKKPELFNKYPSQNLIKKFKFNNIDVLKQQIIELVKEIIDCCNWYDSEIKTIYMKLYTDYYLLQLLFNSVDFERYIKSGAEFPLFCDDIDSSLKECCKQHNIDLKISGIHGCLSGPEKSYNNDFILDLTKNEELISQIKNFEHYLNNINPKFVKNFDFSVGIEFHYLYDWLHSKWTNIKNLLEFYEQIIKLIEKQKQINNDDINYKFNSKKHTYLSHIYSIIYEFLKLRKYDLRDHECKLNENSLPYILDKTINLIKNNNIINCNIGNPFEFEEVKKLKRIKKSNIYSKFKNDFFNKFIDYVEEFKIRNNTFHLNNERKDSPWYKDILIDKIDKLSWWTVDDIKQVITYLKDLIIKPYTFLWNFMRKITNNKLMCSFEELLKVSF